MLPSNLHTAVRHATIESATVQKPDTDDPIENGYQLVARKRNYLPVKRVIDMLFSVVFIITIMTWLLPVVAILIKLSSAGPVFFIQKRVGRNGKLFDCIKFRTMVLNEEADEKPATKNDYRITGIGTLLRRTNIDEFPQLFNVLAGDMSLVGPRPHMIADCIRFSFVIPSYSMRHIVRPGITGWAQAKGYHGPTKDYESILNRYRYDKLYIEKIGLLTDTRILLKTIGYGFYNLGKMIS